jgi:hypothetical protein
MTAATQAFTSSTRAAIVLALIGASLGAWADEAAWVNEARQVASQVPPKLLATLTAAIDKDGAAGAIAVCRDEAPKLAKAASEQSGWNIRRVSLRPRNPKAVPDAWERAALEDFDRRAAAGEGPAKLEKAEVIVEDGKPVQRYMRALPTQQLCLSCHGAAASLSPAVAAQLNSLYPADQAVGYQVGDIRGAMTIKRAQ